MMIPAHAALVADEITGAPDNGWTAVGVIGGAIGAAIVYGVALINGLAAGNTDTSADTDKQQ